MPDQFHTLEPPLAVAAGSRISKIILGLIAVMHGALLLYLPLNSPKDLYNSPDELAAVFFAEGLAEDGHLARRVLHDGLPSSVTPRSMLRADDAFVPVGFVSFPVLLGGLTAILGSTGALLALALLSALSLLAWYGFLRVIFGERLGFISTLITAFHPFVLYWSARPLMPNGWFLAFVFFALYFISRLFRAPQIAVPQSEAVQLERPTAGQSGYRRFIYSAAAGLSLGLTVTLRPQEGLWLLGIPLYIAAVKSLRRKISPAFLLTALGVPILALLLLQNYLYGSPLRTGYHLTPLAQSALSAIRNVILPFGFNIDAVRSVVFNYWIDFVWWFALLGTTGIVFILLRKDGRMVRRFKLWLFGLAIIAAWLLLFYGSFNVQDRFDGSPSIGTSFSRYFLPVYALGIPFSAYALFRVRARLGRVAAAAVVVVGVAVSLRTAFWSTDESLARIPEVMARNLEIRARALEILPEDAVVLTDRSDKIFFPYREVVTRFRKFHQPDFEELYGLNLYYETIAAQEVVDFENERYWGPHYLRATDPVDLGYRHTLYKLKLVKEYGD